MNYLGFDYGKRFIGVAVGQAVTKTARPLQTVMQKKSGPNWRAIGELIQEWQPGALIVGIPLNMDGSSQPVTAKAKQFAHKLADKFELPVHEIDERLSTIEAKAALFDQHGYRALSKTNIDAMAAKLILETWLHT